MVVDAFIHPDLEHVREQVFSHQLQTALMPPVPLSALHVQVDRFHDIGGSGWSAAVKVTESDTRMLTGAAVTFSWGGVTVTWMDPAKEYSPIVAVPGAPCDGRTGPHRHQTVTDRRDVVGPRKRSGCGG
jgi:hypothetical protein